MKNYEEVTYSLLERRDRYMVEKRRKKQKIIAIAMPAFCICLVALVSMGVWNAGKQQDYPPISIESPTTNNPVNQLGPEYDILQKAYPDLTGPSLEQWCQKPDVVWASGYPIKGGPDASTAAGPALGHTMISDDLLTKFMENPDDTVYAVMVDFSYMPRQDYVYEGKKLSDWETLKDDLLRQGRIKEGKAAAIKVCEAKEAYYFERIETFREEFTVMGLGIYHEKYGSTHENCIFYTFATRQQLEEFFCAADEAFLFSSAVRFK